MWYVFDHILCASKLIVPAFQDEIYGSAYAAAVYISSVVKLPKDKKVYVIGQAGLEEELQDEGIAYIGGTVSLGLSFQYGGEHCGSARIQ